MREAICTDGAPLQTSQEYQTPPADNQYQPRMANKSLIEEWRDITTKSS